MSDVSQTKQPLSHAYHPGWLAWSSVSHSMAVIGVIVLMWQLIGNDSLWTVRGVVDISPRSAAFCTLVFSCLYLRAGLYGITFVHRHVAHQAFQTFWWVRAFFFALFLSTMEGWVRIWSAWHRHHHAIPDTMDDRHSPIRYGFVHAQETWHVKTAFLRAPPGKYFTRLDDSAFAPIERMDKHYRWWAMGMGVALPTCICGLGWGDWLNGLFFAGFTRLIVVQHLTSTINSVMHLWGERVEGAGYATNTRWKIFAWLVVGEPYHANHHLKSNMYRLGWGEGDCDPGADMILWLARRGWAWNLRMHTGELLYPK